MRILSRSDVSEENLLTFVRDGWLPIPESIIPPRRNNFLWDTLPLQAYDSDQDYPGKLLDNLRSAIRRSICEWDDVENIDRVGVWLSGGIDSSTLLYLTSEILGPEKVRAYSVNFGDQNEVEKAKLIVDRCHVRLAMKEMTAEDSIHLTNETVLYLRGPVDTTHVVFVSKFCSEDGTGKILSALGLDELQAGYPEHVNATDDEFCEVEADLLWKCQSSWAWAQRVGSRNYVDVKFPFLRRELIAWCRGLPRTHKCVGRDTKVRLRKELSRTPIPEENREAGRTARTKGGFCPILEKWFEDGFREWSNENLPPNGLTSQARLKMNDMTKGYLWRRWRAATINTFLTLLDEGRFDCEDYLSSWGWEFSWTPSSPVADRTDSHVWTTGHEKVDQNADGDSLTVMSCR